MTERNFSIVTGGAQRTESVENALNAISEEVLFSSLVAVHDAARPMVSPKIIREGWDSARESGASIPVVPLTDSIRHINDYGSSAVDRKRYVAVQTPQVFKGRVLKRAYTVREAEVTYTDDASVVEWFHKISLFKGDPLNMKVTQPHDFIIAEALLSK